ERARLAVLVVLAGTRPEDDGKRHGAEAAHGVDDRRAGEVAVAVSEAQRRAPLRHPAATPHPVAEDRVEERAHEELAEQEGPEGDALTDGADDDVAGGLHEDDLEQHEYVDAGVVPGAAQEESLAAEEPPRPVSDQEVVE